MTTQWKDWLPDMLRNWARQYARIVTGGRPVRNSDSTIGWHFDGWPVMTVLAKMRLEGVAGAAQGTSTQHFAEVYEGEAVIVRRAMEGLEYNHRVVIYGKYLAHGVPWREQAMVEGFSKTRWWELHNEGHVYIAGRVRLLTPAPGETIE